MTGEPALSTTAVAGSPVGAYAITAAPGTLQSANYSFTFATGTLRVLYRWDGYLQPINDTAHMQSTMSLFKAGQTVPAKFDIKDAAGLVVQQAVNPGFNYGLIGACTVASPEALDATYLPSTAAVYTFNGGHYQYNWSTKGLGPGLYRIQARLNDGTPQFVDICLR